jgi:hypothetical protein
VMRGAAADTCVPPPTWAEGQAESLVSSDRSPAPRACAAEIRIDQSHRISLAGMTRERADIRARLILAGLATSIGLASIGVVGGHLSLRSDPAASTTPVPISDPAVGPASSLKGDRLPVHRTAARELDREPPVKTHHRSNAPTATAIARLRPSPPVAAAPRPAEYHPAPTRPPEPTTSDSAATPSADAPLTPVPDTRPTTLDGWTIREVVDGTAVLQGPDGVVRAKRGETVPGVGRVLGILRWGNRLIVATSTGLISTP